MKGIKFKFFEKFILSFYLEEEYEDELVKKVAVKKMFLWLRLFSRFIFRLRLFLVEYERLRRLFDEYEKYLVQQQGNFFMSKKGKKVIRVQLELENYMKEKYKKGKYRELIFEFREVKKDRFSLLDYADLKGGKKKGKKEQKKKYKDFDKDYLFNSDIEMYFKSDKSY